MTDEKSDSAEPIAARHAAVIERLTEAARADDDACPIPDGIARGEQQDGRAVALRSRIPRQTVIPSIRAA